MKQPIKTKVTMTKVKTLPLKTIDNKSRTKGNATEYMVAKCLVSMGYKPLSDGYSKKRMTAMGKDYKANKCLERKVCQGLVCILNAKTKADSEAVTFSLMRDTSGSSSSITRTTTDIVVHSDQAQQPLAQAPKGKQVVVADAHVRFTKDAFHSSL